MFLDPSCAGFVGRTLAVKPLYGWGWRRDDQPIDPSQFAPIDQAGVAVFRLVELLEWGGEVRHLIGRVEDGHALFSGLWITCAVMLNGTFDFHQRLCLRYDLSFGASPPQGEWPLAGGASRYEGSGIVAQSEQMIDDYLASLTQEA